MGCGLGNSETETTYMDSIKPKNQSKEEYQGTCIQLKEDIVSTKMTSLLLEGN